MREMKDSGIKWIGVIPSAWRTARVKNVAVPSSASVTSA